MKRERIEASKRFVPMSTPLEVLAERAREDAKWDDLRYYEEQIEKERKKQEEGREDACSKTDIS